MTINTRRSALAAFAGLALVALAPPAAFAQQSASNNGPSNGGFSAAGPSAGSGGGHFSSVRGYKPPRRLRRLLKEGCTCRVQSGTEICKIWTEVDGTAMSRTCTPDS